MKTVSGKVVSSQPLSLWKAAKYLARFSASDIEVSPAFAAYLRRTTAAFDELAQLHKKYKVPLDEVKAKEDHSEGVVTQGTFNSANLAAEDAVPQSIGKGRKREGSDIDGSWTGLSIDKASKGRGVEVQERHDAGRSEMDKAMKSSGQNTYGNVADVGSDGKKSKKKSRGDNGNVAAFDIDHPNGDREATNVVDVKNEMGSLDGSEDLKKEKKKKRDEHEKRSNDVALESDKEVQRADGVGDVADTVQDTQMKHKKKSKVREEQEIDGIRNAEQKDHGNAKNEVKIEREHSSIKKMDGSEDLNKKKRKRDKHEKESNDVGLKIGKQHADGVGHVADTVLNNGGTEKKHKKKSKTKEDDGNAKNEVKEERTQ